MSESVYSIDEIREILTPIFRCHHIRKAVLFGSYAKGYADPNSDIDILVDSGLKGLSFFGLLEDVVTSLGKEVDLIDVLQITPDSPVDQEIRQTGVVIYERQPNPAPENG